MGPELGVGAAGVLGASVGQRVCVCGVYMCGWDLQYVSVWGVCLCGWEVCVPLG